MEELSAKSVEELTKERLELRKAQFNLRMQQSTGQLEKPHQFKSVRKQIAQINTVLAQKAGE